MIIKTNDTGSVITIDGEKFQRVAIGGSGRGIWAQYATPDNSKTKRLYKPETMRKNPEAARVIFDSRNWSEEPRRFRKVYMIEAYTANGDLRFRRYVSNKRAAEKIYRDFAADVMRDATAEYQDGFIRTEWVERS